MSMLRVTGLCEGISPVTGEFPHKGPVTRKIFQFDDVIMSTGKLNKCLSRKIAHISSIVIEYVLKILNSILKGFDLLRLHYYVYIEYCQHNANFLHDFSPATYYHIIW